MSEDSLRPEFIQWVNREVAKLHRQGWFQGSPRETRLLARWRQVRPRMYAALQKAGIAERLATVLEAKHMEAWKEYTRAGMPPTDAEEQAEREWLITEPESESESRSPLLSGRISTLMNPNA